jgi:hypothetical protein
MNSFNLGNMSYDLVRERQKDLMQAAAEERLLRTGRPAVKRRQWWLQLLATLRRWQLVRLWLKDPAVRLSSSVDEASWR